MSGGMPAFRGAPPSGELRVDHGGAIAVDTAQLREIGRRIAQAAGLYRTARESLGRASALISAEPAACPQIDVGALRRSRDRLGELGDELENAATGTLVMADAYEVVELRARAKALALTDEAAAAAAQARLERLLRQDERIGTMADRLVAGWEERRFDGLGDQYDLAGVLPPLFLSGALIGLGTKLGKVLPGRPLQGAGDPVRVTAVATSTPRRGPKSLSGALGRMPSGRAQVAVEKYTMPGGESRYVAYVKGTQESAPWRAGGAEPWDMKSNTELYQGRRSASYRATLDALAAAGVRAGDRVDVVAHSQGGMIAARLAMEGDVDVAMQITAGSPQEPTLTDEQTLIQLRHSDDVVSALAAGGSAEGTGSPFSFTASRVGDPHDGFQDLTLETHGLESYRETAALVDASDDPRAEALDGYWAELADAVRVERTEFRAERTP